MALWPVARKHLPRPATRPQGGGTQRADDEAMFAAVLYVLVSESPWRALPKTFAVSWQNTHRRFTEWSEAGLWDRLRDACRDPQVPVRLRQWADAVALLAERRLERAPAPAHRTPAATAPAGRLKPRILLHGRGNFTARLFGPSHTPAQPARRQSLRRA